MKLGLLGGTFDPVHGGHIAVARHALEHLGLDRVILTVAGDPWMKTESGQTVTAAEHRLRMVTLATRGEPGLEADGREVLRGGPSYSVDTLEELSAGDPGGRVFMLVGSDCLPTLPGWMRPDRVLALATVVVFVRPGPELDLSPLDRVRPGASKEAVVIDEWEGATSSSEIRNALSVGGPVKGLNEDVARYIRDNDLYRA